MPFDYKIVFSSRRSISIIVSPAKGVTVRVPYRTPIKTIEKFVNEKSAWIEKHLERHNELKRLNPSAFTTEGSLLPLLGKQKELMITRAGRNTIRETEDQLILNLADPGDNLKIKAALTLWYKRKALNHLPARFQEMVARYGKYGFRPAGLRIRSLKSRWGSCSSKGIITLNTDLVKLEERFIDYVICHELCHLVHHNHSSRFYSLLAEVYPDWRETRRELKKFII